MGGHNAAAQAQQQPAQAAPAQQQKKDRTARGGFFGADAGTGQAYLGGASDSQRNTFLGL